MKPLSLSCAHYFYPSPFDGSRIMGSNGSWLPFRRIGSLPVWRPFATATVYRCRCYYADPSRSLYHVLFSSLRDFRSTRVQFVGRGLRRPWSLGNLGVECFSYVKLSALDAIRPPLNTLASGANARDGLGRATNKTITPSSENSRAPSRTCLVRRRSQLDTMQRYAQFWASVVRQLCGAMWRLMMY